ncbi:MAG: 1-acyl-sn-glycerol-3-phosphate acyltransferase, partial [Myxococcota bacterium]
MPAGVLAPDGADRGVPDRRLYEELLYRGAPLETTRRKLLARAFRHLEIDEAWAEAARHAAARGPVVYVLRSTSLLDFLALDHLVDRFELPPLGFVNGLHHPLAGQGPRRHDPGRALTAALESHRSAVLFLRCPKTGLIQRWCHDGEVLFHALIRHQRQGGRELLMLPTLFAWTTSPEQRGSTLLNTIFGPADQPTDLRRAGQFLTHYRSIRLRAGEPLRLLEFLRDQGALDQEGDDPALIRRLTYTLLRKVERERRTIVGPAHKPPDRVADEVLRSPKVRRLIDDMAGPGEAERLKLTDSARQMLEEMQLVPDPSTQQSMSLLVDQIVYRLYAGIDVDKDGLDRLRRLTREGMVVLLPSHKSHIDYIVLSYILRQNGISMPAIAAGDNLSFFPAGPILRRCGAFFIRRSFRGDKLYTTVVDAYIRRLMRDGWMLEFFLEGTRSRTGKPLPPKLGLLNMVVTSALGVRRPTYFMPVSIGYERPVEEGAFSRELSGG